jgi:hypothetical protein
MILRVRDIVKRKNNKKKEIQLIKMKLVYLKIFNRIILMITNL